MPSVAKVSFRVAYRETMAFMSRSVLLRVCLSSAARVNYGPENLLV